MALTEFTLCSLGIILTRLKKDEVFADFLSDTVEGAGVTCFRLTPADLHRVINVRKRFKLDFDDAYQYAAAERHGLTLVSFDKDFDRTPRGRKTPAEATSG